MGQDFKYQVMKVRKTQDPAQKTSREDSKIIWGCQHLGQVQRIQLIPASLGPGQRQHGSAHVL